MKHEFFEEEALALDRRARAIRYRDRGKRALDLGLVALAAPVVIPIVAALAVAVRLDGGPAFFAHDRVGLGGRAYRCWKLRTMVPDAAQVLHDHLRSDPAAAREWRQSYKLRNDPRITRMGRLLRKTSLDELPQLWNVLRGEMSLVGPRPVPAMELGEYGGAVWAYTSCRPGITGAWQVSGRNRLGYDERIRLDIGYLYGMGLRRDLAILWRTIPEVLRRGGI